MTTLPLIVVLAAVIRRGDEILVTRRLEGTHLAGLWEFPGGKCEPGETHEACLRREIAEELGVDADIGPELYATEHAYATRIVRLHFRSCAIAGEPRSMLGQDMKWLQREDLDPADFPPADAELIALVRQREDFG